MLFKQPHFLRVHVYGSELNLFSSLPHNINQQSAVFLLCGVKMTCTWPGWVLQQVKK